MKKSKKGSKKPSIRSLVLGFKEELEESNICFEEIEKKSQ